ncbi:MAG: glycosyl hydrolase, partial [Verrucomicrobia bacterium]|nr:glycosyl hydrolase [Verrucomicrobiota bacterium]
GQITRPAPAPGLGFETDKFDPAAIDAHFEKFVGTLLKEIGPRKKGTGGLSTLHFDSWEMSSQNWSEQFRAEFQRRRGYDPLRFLPAYTGRVVDSAETTERFLWDLRQTAQELVIENHVTRLKTLAHKNDLSFSLEPYDMNPTADLSLGAVADVPMCEFWWLGYNSTFSVIEAASIAHTGGRKIVAAESFTSNPGEDWQAYPANMKSLGDWAFAAGVNRIAFHRYQHQPVLDRWPGMQMGPYGVHWERTQTWWPLVSAYHEYLSRCQFLLREGESVADILFLAGEGAPHVFRAPPSATVGNPPDRRGYNFDGCAPETLLAKAKVSKGRIIFPGGTSYRLLVLSEMETMTPALLRKVKELVQAGATVVGAPPKKSPSLSNFPKADAEVQKLAGELWGGPRGAGKGHILWGAEFEKSIIPATSATNSPIESKQDVQPLYPHYDALARVLQATGVPPDFDADGPIRYTHRTTGDTEIYFVANRAEQPVDARCVFRVAGRQPEMWHPVTGERRALPAFAVQDGRTTLVLRFEPLESYFIVFRKRATAPEKSSPNFDVVQSVQEIAGPWQVTFDSKWSAPEQATFATLEDWTKRPEEGIKFFSGMATYRQTFAAPDSKLKTPNSKLFLDLGMVKNMARVRLNGHDLGVVWCAPWRVAIPTDVLRNRDNQIEITVANLWINRLIGDAALPPEKRRTWTSKNPYKPDSALLESGLLGPVTLWTTGIMEAGKNRK